MPNDSPWSDGAQNADGAAQAGDLLLVGDTAEPLDAWVVGELRLQARRLGTVARNLAAHVGAELLHRLEEHGEALPFLMPAAEEDGRVLVDARGPLPGSGRSPHR